MTELTLEAQLSLISRAWGKHQTGYCFFPWIPGNAADKKARVLGYTEGPAFHWPRDKAKILQHMARHRDDDLYWCPNLFEDRRRHIDLAMDARGLWADLDEVDPREISDLPPTIAWETSPGRFQGLWLCDSPKLLVYEAGRENQKLTYHLGADRSGWDATQLLRIPGWKNHKPEYRERGTPRGRLLWDHRSGGGFYTWRDFDDLPDVPEILVQGLTQVFEEEVDALDPHTIWARVRLKVTRHVRELVRARETSGDRSDVLWQIERELADAGCTVPEIVAIVRQTVWNKFAGRHDEYKQLVTEASKAVAARQTKEADEGLEAIDDESRPPVTNLFTLLADVKKPNWLIRGILNQGAVGFIAGQPKSFKSWTALDMGLSVASGQPFLNHFPIESPGSVLYIQEEDSPALLKTRVGKIWSTKLADRVTLEGTSVMWVPATEESVPDIDAYVGHGFTISDDAWQSWLDEVLEDKADSPSGPYRLVIFDPLMMMAGDAEEHKAQQMTSKVFRPLKQLSRKHGCAIQVVHHMKKSDGKSGGPVRGGQMLLGSVANHAWAEDSLYFYHQRGAIFCEQESKLAPVGTFRITNLRNKRWAPLIEALDSPLEDNDDISEVTESMDRDTTPQAPAKKRTRGRPNRVLEALQSLGPGSHTPAEIQALIGTITSAGVHKSLKRMVEEGTITTPSRGHYALKV